jgi:Cd2+/Zn2+-exporting ATPase
MTKKQKREMHTIIIAAVIYAVVLVVCTLFDFKEIAGSVGGILIELALFLVPYVLVSRSVYKTAWSNIKNGEIFDENFLMLVATIGAIGTGELSEAVAVMIFYQVGELFQSIAVNKSRQSVTELMDIVPEYANLVKGDEIVETDPDDILVGETIVIRPGERIPLDCRIIKGSSMIDTSALTGESVPRSVSEGEEIISGCVNGEGVLYAEVLKRYEDSTVARILELVENASEKKAVTEKFITRFARYYTPAVVFAALAIAVIPPIFAGDFRTWLYRACTFLVVSCPCALVISVPMSFFCGIGSSSKNGILVKGSNYLELLAQMDTVVFDKTGTLTKGEFKVTAIVPTQGVSEAKLLETAALAESFSTHPVAAAIRTAWNNAAEQRVTDVSEIAGHGIKAVIDGKTVYAGNKKLMDSAGIDTVPVSDAGTVIYVGMENEFLGYIVIADSVKDGAADALKKMKKLGVKQTVMLTGDKYEAAQSVAAEIGVDSFYAELLPADKVSRIEALLESGSGKVAFAGDGINDAPVLMRSDIGIAMGSMGSDAAIEAADVVLMDDNLMRIPLAIRIARKTTAIVKQNIIFAIGVKFAILILTAFGYANMWAAVFADVGVAVIAILNAMRALYIKE